MLPHVNDRKQHVLGPDAEALVERGFAEPRPHAVHVLPVCRVGRHYLVRFHAYDGAVDGKERVAPEDLGPAEAVVLGGEGGVLGVPGAGDGVGEGVGAGVDYALGVVSLVILRQLVLDVRGMRE